MAFAPTRIFRSPASNFYGDECLEAPSVYTEQELAQIAAHGFNGIWLRGRLAELVQSVVLPELNQERSEQRLEVLRTLIGRCSAHGIGVWLYFNEPLAPASDAPIWDRHPELKGATHYHDLKGEEQHYTALCTSHPTVRTYMRQATAQVMGALAGLAGVILITASEYHSHCWSHRATLGQQYMQQPAQAMACPRCGPRGPAQVVGELVGWWQEAASALSPAPRVVAWNWSWSMWYPEPQKPVIDRLPQGVALMADWERGDQRLFEGQPIPIDEYSLSFVGPSQRFVGSLEAARGRGLEVFAKLQLGTTHELGTVPNLPLISSIHGKLAGLYQRGLSGFMGCWNFGCARTINTDAVSVFADDPDRAVDRDCFYADLSRRSLGIEDSAPLARAWEAFTSAFELYPFSIQFLYYSFLNYAPAYPLSLEYHARAMGPSWLVHAPWGDDLEQAFAPFTGEQVLRAFDAMHARWDEALPGYLVALAVRGGSTIHRQRREQEASCARMIGIHLRSAVNILRFHLWRKAKLEGCSGPLPWRAAPDASLKPIVSDELQAVAQAMDLMRRDPRLGFHQECQAYLYTPAMLQQKQRQLTQLMVLADIT